MGALCPLLLFIKMDEREIIYLALINQIEHYKEVLDDTSNPLKEEERTLAEYIFMRTLEIEEKYYAEFTKEDQEKLNSTIKRPKWD